MNARVNPINALAFHDAADAALHDGDAFFDLPGRKLLSRFVSAFHFRFQALEATYRAIFTRGCTKRDFGGGASFFIRTCTTA